MIPKPVATEACATPEEQDAIYYNIRNRQPTRNVEDASNKSRPMLLVLK